MRDAEIFSASGTIWRGCRYGDLRNRRCRCRNIGHVTGQMTHYFSTTVSIYPFIISVISVSSVSWFRHSAGSAACSACVCRGIVTFTTVFGGFSDESTAACRNSLWQKTGKNLLIVRRRHKGLARAFPFPPGALRKVITCAAITIGMWATSGTTVCCSV